MGRIGQIAWNKGQRFGRIKKNCRTCGIEFESKICSKRKYCSVHCSAVQKIGEKNHKWVSNRTQLQRYNNDSKDRISSTYREWRKQVWLRDNFVCKIANPDCAGRIEAHHILGYKEHPELRYQINNGITLCHFHHPRRRKEEKRLSPYFQNLATVSR